MGNITSHKILDIKRISAFKDGKASHVERLKSMGGISRHIKRNNIVVLVILFEFDEIVAFVTVKDKETLNTLGTRLNILIKMFNPFDI